MESLGEINVEEFSKGEKIKGNTNHSRIYKAAKKGTNFLCVVKIIDNNTNDDEYDKSIKRQIAVMETAVHPTIVSFIGFSRTDFFDEENIMLFIEYCKEGSLLQILNKTQKKEEVKNYTNTNRQIILIGVARGMKFIHNHNIIHRDLKPGNVLLNDFLEPKITDFEVAKKIDIQNSYKQTGAFGTSPYMAPEMFATVNEYDRMADVYSFGILMYEIVTDLVPYPDLYAGRQSDQQFRNDVLKNRRPKFPPNVQKNLKKLIERCWDGNGKKRPTFDEIYSLLTKKEYFLDNVDEQSVKDYIEEINDDVPPKKQLPDINTLSVSSFNDQLLIDQQHLFEKMPDTDFFNRTNDFLAYLATFRQKKSRGWFQIECENEQKLILNIDANCKLILSSDAMDALFNRPDFNYEEFNAKIQLFRRFAFKLKYPSDTFQRNYDYVVNLKNSPNNMGEYELGIFISGVQEIKKQFAKNKNIDSVAFSDEIQISTKIGEYAFSECSSLKKIAIPDSVTLIGPKAFYRCTSLEEVIIPVSVKNVGELAFCECTSLSKVEVSFSHTSIGDRAFDGCSKLKKISIPSTKIGTDEMHDPAPTESTRIGNNAFYKCESLEQIMIPSPVESIGEFSFSGCSLLNEVSIASSVTKIGKSAFSECSKLYEIHISASVTSIEERVFNKCTSLKTITIPNTVKNIGQYAFNECKLLTNINLPNALTSIEDFALNECRALSSIIIPPTVKSIGKSALCHCVQLKEIVIPPSVTKIDNSAFYGCSLLSKVEIPESVVSIGKESFRECNSLTELKLPESLKEIKSSAFKHCKSLIKINIPKSITSFEIGIFTECFSLTEIAFPDNLQSLGFYCFYQCTSLREIKIPPTVKSIGQNAFTKCSSLVTVQIPPSVEIIGNDAFSECTSLFNFICPRSLNIDGIGLSSYVKVLREFDE